MQTTAECSARPVAAKLSGLAATTLRPSWPGAWRRWRSGKNAVLLEKLAQGSLGALGSGRSGGVWHGVDDSGGRREAGDCRGVGDRAWWLGRDKPARCHRRYVHLSYGARRFPPGINTVDGLAFRRSSPPGRTRRRDPVGRMRRGRTAAPSEHTSVALDTATYAPDGSPGG